MEVVFLFLGVLVALIVTAVVMDLKARRRGRRNAIDPGAVRDARWVNDARGGMYGPGEAVSGGGDG